MGQAGSVARTSYILLTILDIKNQMLFLVVFRGIIMLSIGKKCNLIERSTYTSLLLERFAIFP